MDKEAQLRIAVSDLLTKQKFAIQDLVTVQETVIKEMQEQNNVMERKILILEEEVRKLKTLLNYRL